MIIMSQWHRLVTSSLSHLNTFKFKFNCSHFMRNSTIHEKLKDIHYRQTQSRFIQSLTCLMYMN
jgi:hypothetical protein